VPNFCPVCGQESRVEVPRVRDFLQQFGGAYFSTEGALWRTLKLLLTQPGELTVQYLAGRRKHYVLPLRLYLTISVALLLLTRVVGSVEAVALGLDRPELRAAERGTLPTLLVQVGSFSLGIRDGVFVCRNLPAALCTLVRDRAAPDSRTLLERLRRANERLLSNFGAVMFVILPLFAGCLMLVHHGRGMAYGAHLVFTLHLHAFWFLVLALMRVVPFPAAWAGVPVMVVYTGLAGRRVYGGPWGPRLLRGLALTALYMLLLAVTVPAVWLLGLVA
jgi:hypothetical protein